MIIVRLQGGMGNQMFQYALGRVLAIKNNTELIFNTEGYDDKSKRLFKSNFAHRSYDLGVFNIKGRVAKSHEIPFFYKLYFKGKLMVVIDAVRRRILRHKGHELYFKKFNPQFLEFGNNTYLDGFFQSYKYFLGYENIIKKDFTLKNELPENIRNLKAEILNINSLCVFVRRQDFVGHAYHEVVDREYYDKSVEYLSSKLKIDKIYVFSDDIEWCKNNLKFDTDTMFVSDEYAGTGWSGHMMLMSCCKYFIIPNSTFAWWGAWLSEREGKLVLFPHKWARDNSVVMDDVVPNEWIKM